MERHFGQKDGCTGVPGIDSLFQFPRRHAPTDSLQQVCFADSRTLFCFFLADESRTIMQMTRKGIEFTLVEAPPGFWKWSFQIGETVNQARP